MKKPITFIPAIAILAVLLVSGALAVEGIKLIAQQAQDAGFAKERSSKVLTVHHYGIQAEVLNPGLDPKKDRIVRVHDLGSNISFLEEDLAPTSAVLKVNSYPTQSLEFNAQGVLEARIPASWLSLISSNDSNLTVFHNGQTLSKINLEGVFF